MMVITLMKMSSHILRDTSTFSNPFYISIERLFQFGTPKSKYDKHMPVIVDCFINVGWMEKVVCIY